MEFAEIPEKFLELFEDEDFVFIPIGIGENKEKVRQKMLKMKKYGVDFNVGIDPTKKNLEPICHRSYSEKLCNRQK